MYLVLPGYKWQSDDTEGIHLDSHSQNPYQNELDDRTITVIYRSRLSIAVSIPDLDKVDQQQHDGARCLPSTSTFSSLRD